MQLRTFTCVLAGLLVLSCTLQTAVTESNSGKMKSMAEVLQILQNLDKYYSQAARPSFWLTFMFHVIDLFERNVGGANRIIELTEPIGKKTLLDADNFCCERAPVIFTSGTRTNPAGSPITDMSEIQEAVHKIRLRELDRNYLQRTRPRFGKRTYPALEERLFNGEEVPIGEPQPWEHFIR